MRSAAGLGLVMALTFGAAAAAEGADIDFIEDFALADDRAKALEQLIPGTEEHSYYSCLLLQSQGKLDEVDKALRAWSDRHGQTARYVEIENRQALLRYDRDPKAALEFLRWRMGLSFNHEREVAGKQAGHPTRLDPKLYDRRALLDRALADYSDASGLEDRGLELLFGTSLTPERRRALLARLRRPDVPDLPRLVVDDLRHPHSRSFGSMPIHGAMLLSQLDECAKLLPSLKDEAAFVRAYVTKLQPGPDVEWRHDEKAREAYLERLWAYVKGLSPAHNSLKAHVLHHRLDHDRRKGVYDKARFLEYLAIPRHAPYANPDYLRRPGVRESVAQLAANFQAATALPTVSSDEPLVRDYLLTLLRGEDDWRAYSAYVADEYLKQAFAEAKILAGAGDMERWYALIGDPGRYQALKDRVDIEFAPTCRTWFGPEEPVVLDVDVKNVKTLVVKVFEIDSTSYFRARRAEVDLSVDLDGLVANEERTHAYEEPPLRRVRRRLEFPTLARRGVFAVELIGNGKSSRALIRKGQLRFVERAGAAGHLFTVLDEANRPLQGATVTVDGREHRAEEDGTILVPYTSNPGPRPVILTHDGFSTLERFQHRAETYALRAGIYVDRESLLRRGKAKLIVRPSLTLAGEPVALALLEQPALSIESVDRSGVRSTKEVAGIALVEGKDLVHEMAVPDDLSRLAVTLRGKVKLLSTGATIDLADGETFDLNRIDATDRVDDLHLARTGAGHVLALLGKNGEPKRDRPVTLTLKHRDFTRTVEAVCQTDAEGRVDLGPLDGIATVRAVLPDGLGHTWRIDDDRRVPARTVHARAGETVAVPYMGRATGPARAALSLLERRGDGFVADWFSALAVADGFVEARGLPPGSYSLFLKEHLQEVAIEVAPGEVREGHILGEMRILEARRRGPLQVASVEAGEADLKVRVRNAGATTRVHVVATRFLPPYPIFDRLAMPIGGPRESRLSKDESFYVSGRDIGDEYRYILERRFATKYPGNLLARPGLLLNPWAVRKTDTEVAGVGGGSAYGSRMGGARRLASEGGGLFAETAPDADALFSSFDFLREPSAVLANLAPDASGVVTVPRKDLGGGQHVHVVAVDGTDTVYRSVALPKLAIAPRDLRLMDALPPAKHFSEQKRVTLLSSGSALDVADLTTSRVEVYDTLRRAFGLLSTLSSDPTLVEFSFVLDWPKLTPEEKRAKYSKYACHELSFFVYKKDRAFFDAVVRPYLANKKDKTFLDRWLLGEDLKRYLEPWAHARLNIVEKILLAERFPGEPATTARHVRDLFDLVPPDLEREQHLYRTAIAGSALETGDALGIGAAREKAETKKMAELERAESGAGPAGVAATGRAFDAPMEAPATLAPPPAPPAAAPRPEKPGAKMRMKNGAPAAADGENDSKEEAAAGEDRDGYDEREGEALKRDLERRAKARPLYRPLEQTEEWAENNYYRLEMSRQTADLITVNGFWVDYAAHVAQGGGAPFLSARFPEASRGFAEAMLALAVLDLPFEAGAHEATFEGARMQLAAKSPAVVFHKEILESAPAKEAAPVLVGQNLFRLSDRWRYERGERFDKYVGDELLLHTGYGCQVVVTNPTSSRRKVDVLLQIPRGALPIQGGFLTRGRDVRLEPYSTVTFEYAFYFPATGSFTHFPVHVSQEGALLASAAPASLTVVETPTRVDTTSWDFISQDAPPEDVLRYLESANLGRVDLSRIAWRVRDRAFFERALAILARRHAYDHTLWSYALHHDDRAAAREFLRHADGFVEQVGLAIDCTLLALDPVERGTYEHLEYVPLVNARAHQLGRRRQILNDRLHAQYHALLKVLSYRARLDDADRLAVAYYLLLQDRVEEGLRHFARVDPAKVPSRLQYDYMRAYVDLYGDERRVAREVATAHKDHPVDRWRKLFLDVLDKLDEADGKKPTVVDSESREQRQGALASSEAAFDFTVESRKVTVSYQNLAECRVHYYLMDVELLFSKNPFVQQRGGQFSFVKPNRSEVVKFPEGRTTFAFDLPAELANANIMVEIVAGGVRKSVPYFANSLVLKTVESYGQLRVTRAGAGAPLAKAYVKTYARMRDGSTRFYKDGYTDLRGCFDYSSISTGDLENVDRFALLVLSETNGAVIHEAAPPAR